MKKMDQEFKEFCDSKDSAHAPTGKLRDPLFTEVFRDLNPNPYYVFSKLLAIHSLTALFTLSVCPQFGFRVWGDGMGLMRIFMHFGTYGCLVLCGGFFTSMSLIAAGMLLKGEELRTIRNNRWLTLGALVSLSLGFFFMLDAEILFGLTAAWFLGAVLASQLTLELTWRARFQAR